MSHTLPIRHRLSILIATVLVFVGASRIMRAETGVCGGQTTTLPFADLPQSNIFFCSIAEAYFSGLTNGTSPTTYNPSDPVPREQMAAFITRTHDSALKRGSRRAALKQWWTPTSTGALQSVDLNNCCSFVEGMTCDGADVWVSDSSSNIKRVRASDGKVLQTWSASGAEGLIVAAGKIFIAGVNGGSPGKIYVIDPTGTPGAATVFENSIGVAPMQITFDGTNLWTANDASISRVDMTTGTDSTFTSGFGDPNDILWDGTNLWIVDTTDSHLKRIDVSSVSILESIAVVPNPRAMAFDGANIWVTGGGGSGSNNISVVRAVGAFRGTVLATLSSGGANPTGIAFDGERMLVCNQSADSVSLFKAADLTMLGTLATGFQSIPFRACSDGLNFWIGLGRNPNTILRF